MWSIFQLCLEFFEYWIKFDIVQVNPEVFQKAVVCCFKYNVISEYVKEYAFEAPNNLVTGRIQIFSALIYEIAKLLKIKILKSRKKGNPSNFFNSLIWILIWFICHLICHLGDIHLVRTQNFRKICVRTKWMIPYLTEIDNEYLQTCTLIKTLFWRKQIILKKNWIYCTLKLIPFKIVTRKY